MHDRRRMSTSTSRARTRYAGSAIWFGPAPLFRQMGGGRADARAAAPPPATRRATGCRARRTAAGAIGRERRDLERGAGRAARHAPLILPLPARVLAGDALRL